MGIIAERDQQLNDAINTGRVIEVFRDVYHPDLVMYENDTPGPTGLDANFEKEKQFFGSITEFRGGGVTKSAVNEAAGLSFAEMWFDCTLANGFVMKMTEVAVREWKDGRIVKERFFYKAQ